jgi:putative PEP-CTERM system TPR-repeat lipoprotein
VKTKILNTVILIAFISIVGCSEKTTDERLEEAAKLQQSGEITQAIIELKNALIAEPKSREARFNLGKLYYLSGQFANAEKELRMSEDLGETPDNFIPLLAKSMYYQDDFDRVYLLTKQFKSENPQIQSEVDLFRYLSAIRSNIDDADALQFPTNLIGDHLILAQTYQALYLGNLTEASEYLELFTQPEIEPLEKLLVAGFVHVQLEQNEAAVNDYTQAMGLLPNYYFIRFQLADLLVKIDELQKAQKHVDYLLDINADSAYANLLQAKIYFKKENFTAALVSAEKANPRGTVSLEASFIGGISAFKLKKPETAYLYLSQIADQFPPTHIVNRIFAEVRLQLGYVDEVLAQIKDIDISDEENSKLLGAIAVEKFRDGDLIDAAKYFAQANTIDKNNAKNQLREGLARLSTNDISGVKNLENAIKYDDSVNEAWMLLIESHLRNNKPLEALKIAQKWQETDKINGLTLEGYIYLKTNENEKARSIFNQVLALEPLHLSTSRFLMLLDAREEKFTQAIDIAQQLISKNPSNFNLMIDLINFGIAQADLNAVEKFLKKTASENDNEIAPISALGLLYAWQKTPNIAIELLEKHIDRADPNFIMVLGDIYIQQGQFDKAINTFQLWTNQFPNDSRGWFRLISTYEISGKIPLASETTQKALSLFPNDPRLIALNANYFIDLGKISEASGQLKSIEKYQSDIPGIQLFKGKLALSQKNYKAAVDLLSPYYDKHPSFENAVLLAYSLQGINKADKGAEVLEIELQKLGTAFIEFHTVAEYCTANKMYDKAAKYYAMFLKKNPAHFITLNNYAAVELERGNLDSAENLAKEAVRLQPKSPFALDTYGWVLFKKGQTLDALTFISKANEALPQNNEIKFHLIEILIASGNTNKAKTVLSSITVMRDSDKAEINRLKGLLREV